MGQKAGKGEQEHYEFENYPDAIYSAFAQNLMMSVLFIAMLVRRITGIVDVHRPLQMARHTSAYHPILWADRQPFGPGPGDRMFCL
jgi:hypothetical protein